MYDWPVQQLNSKTPNDNTKSWIAHKAVVTGSDFEMGGYLVIFTQVKLTFPYISAFGICMFIYALVFPYIFLLVDHFKWALIDDIEQWRVHSVLWQFWVGGYIVSFTWVKLTFPLYLSLVSVCLYICTGISLYILICWPFWMGPHWQHWTVKSSLSALAVSNGGRSSSVLLG